MFVRATSLTALLMTPAAIAPPETQGPARFWVPIAEHDSVSVEGFTLVVDKRLIAKKDLHARTMREVSCQLWQIARRLPAPALEKLRRVKIYVEARSKTACMAYHPSRRWLTRNEFNPDLAKCVELGNPGAFLSWTKQQPWMILHELAHAYHDQFLTGGFGNKAVAEAFAIAAKTKKYESVLHIDGLKRRHYALSNAKEYFAEATEAFFGTNDFYPFVASELREFDPGMHTALRKAWGAR